MKRLGMSLALVGMVLLAAYFLWYARPTPVAVARCWLDPGSVTGWAEAPDGQFGAAEHIARRQG